MQTIEKLLVAGDKLFLIWDIAKTYGGSLLQLQQDVANFMWRHSDRIREVHAHDFIEKFRSHQIIGEGELPFIEYAPVLRRQDIAVTIEVRPREAAVVSRDHLLAITGESAT